MGRGRAPPTCPRGPSKVTFTIEQEGQIVKLTVIHDDFEPGSHVANMVSNGWPNVLTDLKTLLETGEPGTDVA